MASISPRKDKSGNVISYQIRVHRGRDAQGKQLKPFTMTWTPLPEWKPARVKKELQRAAALFEQNCKDGNVTTEKQTFDSYARYVIELKARTGIKVSTTDHYIRLLTRINDVDLNGIGHIKLQDIRPDHLNRFYKALEAPGTAKTPDSATVKVKDLRERIISASGTFTRFCNDNHIGGETLRTLLKGKPIQGDTARRIAAALNSLPDELFRFRKVKGSLSAKTVIEYHRFISTVFAQAVKEGIVPVNIAQRATPPKQQKSEAESLEPEDIQNLFKVLSNEPLKWQAMINLLIATGARRGEIFGLQWKNVDFNNNQLYLCVNLLYSPERGIYTDTLKTNKSRYVTVAQPVIDLLRMWRAEQSTLRLALGREWQNGDFVFTQENGLPMSPSSLTTYLNRLEKVHGLPHMNPHKFRHTQASILIEQGVDIVTVSKRLGHAKPSTTADYYAHMLNKADEKANAAVANVLYKLKAE